MNIKNNKTFYDAIIERIDIIINNWNIKALKILFDAIIILLFGINNNGAK